METIKITNKTGDTIKENIFAEKYSENVAKKYNYLWESKDSYRIFNTLFETIANVLATKKSKTDPVSVIIKSIRDDKFKLGAKVTFHENENEDIQGNISIEFSLNEEDFADIKDENTFSITSPEFITIMNDVSFTSQSVQFSNNEFAFNMLIEVVDTIVEIVDEELKDQDTTIEIVVEGYLTINGQIEEGEKVVALTPGSTLKTIVKGE